MKDERLSQRIEIELPAKLCFQAQPNAWTKATIINISTNGFCFRTEAKFNDLLNEKPIVRLQIAIAKKESVELVVQVVWAGKTSSYHCLAGGEIPSPSGPDYEKILEFYTKLLRERL
ncbi:MAG TPA: PilZ domain-containing protein [Candidatus Omnitrophota bacterium]|nr:PilZ domain-containing protein [Candidatus Omnitrophota bacterium]